MFKRLLPYLITAVIGAAVAVPIICLRGIWTLPVREQMGILSDAFFVPGIIIAGAGLIIFASNGGAFDMLAFGAIMFFNLFRKDLSKRKYKDFYEYRQAKKDKKRDMAFMLIVGVAFMVIAAIFLILYYNV